MVSLYKINCIKYLRIWSSKLVARKNPWKISFFRQSHFHYFTDARILKSTDKYVSFLLITESSQNKKWEKHLVISTFQLNFISHFWNFENQMQLYYLITYSINAQNELRTRDRKITMLLYMKILLYIQCKLPSPPSCLVTPFTILNFKLFSKKTQNRQ